MSATNSTTSQCAVLYLRVNQTVSDQAAVTREADRQRAAGQAFARQPGALTVREYINMGGWSSYSGQTGLAKPEPIFAAITDAAPP